MKNTREVEYDHLGSADLFVDAVYKGGSRGNVGDDPINKLLGCGNQGGFRFVGNRDAPRYCILYSDQSDPDWPDSLDLQSGQFAYFGDQKRPGHELHDTSRGGNWILRHTFNSLHMNRRIDIPPFFIFTKASRGRDVVFRGLAVPGAKGLNQDHDLVAIWKLKHDQRFQNYKAVFTILNVPSVSRTWIDDIARGDRLSPNTPPVWRSWIIGSGYSPLTAPKSVEHRTRLQQIPKGGLELEILSHLISFFKRHKEREYAFERCAAELAAMMDRNIYEYDLTRPWRDGGRDAVGKYRIGPDICAITVDFALEAKCKLLSHGSGVKETSRLISRLRHRQFGIFVTTSYVAEQAYKELIEDKHPVIILSGSDIAKLLIESGYNSKKSLDEWLQLNFA